jgi:hypothetical protein
MKSPMREGVRVGCIEGRPKSAQRGLTYPLTTMRSGIAARGGTARSLRGVLPK